MVSLRDRQKAWTATREEAETLAASLPPLLVEAERVAATVAQGVHGRHKVGIGETFWEYRHHRPQDSYTAIDWRQSAKSDHLYVRENEWEAAESVWLWRDTSASMTYQSEFAPCSKLDRATVLALAVASLLVRGGERIAQLGAPEPPATGRNALRRYALALSARDETGDNVPEDIPLPRFSQTVLISDFLTSIDRLDKTIRFYASCGVKGHLVQIFDPAEEDLPFEGRVRFEAIEDKTETTFERVESVRELYQRNVKTHRDALAGLTQRLGWSFTTHRTDRPPETALLALYTALAGETMSDVGQMMRTG